MTEILTSNWRISEDAVANAVGGETVILHLGNGNYFGLDPIGTQLWEGLQSGQSPSEVCDQILDQYEVERGALEADITRFLEELKANDLVEPA